MELLAPQTALKCADDNVNDFPDTADIIKRNFYMDDLFVLTDTVDEAISLFQTLRCVLVKGGFILTKWTTTSQDILYSIPETHRGISHVYLQSKKLQQRVLGLIWDLSSDQLQFNPLKFKN